MSAESNHLLLCSGTALQDFISASARILPSARQQQHADSERVLTHLLLLLLKV
jgi:hypothetical protein